MSHLEALALVVLDPLLDLHWAEIGQEFEQVAERSRQLRRAYSCTMPDIPNDAIQRLDALLGPGDDLG